MVLELQRISRGPKGNIKYTFLDNRERIGRIRVVNL